MAEGGGGEATTEIHAKLVLDEDAKKAAENLKEGFEHIGEKVHEVEHELGELLKTTLAVAAGFELDRGIESIKELGHEVMNAATASENTEKSIAGLLAMTDKTGKSFEELSEQAKGVHDDLEDIGIRAGASGESVGEAFELIAERSKKSADEIVNLTDKMALAGKILPGGVGQIAAAWRDFESGIVRPRNALVQLMIQSHTVAGSMRQVAHQLTTMMQTPEGQEKAFKMAEAAITKMADKAKDAPLSYNQLIASLKSIRELAFKEAGEPIIAALKGPLNDLRDYFVKNRHDIEEWAHMVGEKTGVWVVEAADKIKDGFEYLKNHADEIEHAFKEGFAFAKAVVEFIIAHREELALAWGGSKLAGAGMGLVKGGASLIGSMGGLAGGLAGGEGAFGTAIGAGAASATVALGAFGVALAAVGVAAYEWNEMLNDVWVEKQKDTDARVQALQRAAQEGQIEAAQQLRDQLVVTNPQVTDLANRLVEFAEAMHKVGGVTAQQSAWTERDLAFEETEAGKGGQAAKFAVENFMKDLDTAVGSQDAATLKHMATFITTHGALIDAMHTAGVDLTKEGKFLVGALEGLGTEQGHMRAEELRGILAKQTKEAATSAAPVFNFSGPITIHQDFKDQDPDRVVAIMRRDLVRTAGARIQSRGADAHAM
jgi:hypothetical protein